MPRLPGGPATNLPACPRTGHGDRPVVKDGQYGSPPRQRYRCIGEAVNEVTGEVRSFHRFTTKLPRQAVSAGVCDTCDNTVGAHQGPVVARTYAFPLREVAAAFVSVGTGASYYRAADRARVAACRRRLDGAHGGAVVAEWLDVFGPPLLAQYAETEWPETLVLDSTRFMADNVRTGTSQLAFNVLGAYGYPAKGRARVWALRASHQATAVEWEALLRSLDISKPPRLVITDGAVEIRNAVRAVWPELPGPSLPQPFVARCEHHLHVNGVEAMTADGWAGWASYLRRRLDTAFLREEGWAELLAQSAGFGNTTAWLAGIRDEVGLQVGVAGCCPTTTRPPRSTPPSDGSATSSTRARSCCATPPAPTSCSGSSATTSTATTSKAATAHTCEPSLTSWAGSPSDSATATTPASTPGSQRSSGATPVRCGHERHPPPRQRSDHEAEQLSSCHRRLRRPGEPVHAHREERISRCIERLLDEPCIGQPAADRGRQVRSATRAGPDDGRVRRAQLRQLVNGTADVAVADVAEHAAHEHQVGGHRAQVGVSAASVPTHHLNAGEAGVARCPLRDGHVAGVELNQTRTHRHTLGRASQRLDKVPPLARARAHHAQFPTAMLVQPGRDALLDKT
jgi:hypothetical protein